MTNPNRTERGPGARSYAVLLTFVMVTGLLSSTPAPVEASHDEDNPNIVMVFIDDADRSLLGEEAIRTYFPQIERHLLDEGTLFDNFQTNTPLCGPIRASLFRGQYAHNTEIKTNMEAPPGSDETVPTGSWSEFYGRGYVNDEIGVWMQDAGYKTMLVGKYHHDRFPNAAPEGTSYVAPGWDEFYVSQGAKYYGTRRLINGEVTNLAPFPAEYRTDVERDDVIALLETHDEANDDQPFLMYFAPFGPHGQGTSPDPMYAQRHADLFPDVQVARTPDFNEGDVSDKAQHFQDFYDPMTESQREAMDRRHQERLRAMMAIDEAIGAIVETLEDLEELEDTVIVLASDNGYAIGQHRIRASKRFPYNGIYNVPMLVRGPNVPTGETVDHLVTVADLAPTFLDLADAPIPAFVDGQSIVPLLDEDPIAAPSWRSAVLIENWEGTTKVDADYRAIRMIDSSYVEWATGEKEYYDHTTDPYELENQYDNLTPEEQAELAGLLAHHENCSGGQCNDVLPEPQITSLANVAATSIDFVPSITGRGPAPITPIPVGAAHTIQGSASAEAGVTRVLVVVKDRTTGQYWNGTGFEAAHHRIEADLAAPGEVFTSWELTLPASLSSTGRLLITARAYSTPGVFDRSIPRMILRYES